MRASLSTMKAIVALAWLAVLLASDDAGAVSAATGAEYWRTPWPEVVGMSSSEALKNIKEHWTGYRAHVIPAGAAVLMNYDTSRVRVFVDSNDKVAEVRIG